MANLTDTLVNGSLRVTGKIYGNVPTAPAGTSTEQIASTAFVTTAIENLPEPMIFKGSLGTGGTITTLPAAAKANEGFTYKVITEGTYAGKAAKVGDTFISTGSAWELIPSGDEPSGTVTSVGLTGDGPITVTGSPITSSGTLALSFGTTAIGNGGTGATTQAAAQYNIIKPQAATEDLDNNKRFAFITTGPSATEPLIFYRTGSTVWSWIKGKLSSDTGVNISGSSAKSGKVDVSATGYGSIVTTEDGETLKKSPLFSTYSDSASGNLLIVGSKDTNREARLRLVQYVDGSANRYGTLTQESLSTTQLWNLPDESGTVQIFNTARVVVNGSKSIDNYRYTKILTATHTSTSNSGIFGKFKVYYTTSTAFTSEFTLTIALDYNGGAISTDTSELKAYIDDSLTDRGSYWCSRLSIRKISNQSIEVWVDRDFMSTWSTLRVYSVPFVKGDFGSNRSIAGSSIWTYHDTSVPSSGAVPNSAATLPGTQLTTIYIRPTYMANAIRTQRNAFHDTTLTNLDNFYSQGSTVFTEAYGASVSNCPDTTSWWLVECRGGNGSSKYCTQIATRMSGNNIAGQLNDVYIRTCEAGTWRAWGKMAVGEYLPLAGGTLSGPLIFSGDAATGAITWNSGSWWQRIINTDDSNADTPVFTFQQSSDAGKNWTDLMTIKDNSKVVATTFVGDLTGNAATASAAKSGSALETAINGKAASSHTHGNINNDGTLQTKDIDIANGDKLVVTDASGSNKVARASIFFDGTTETQALTKKGTWKAFLTDHQDITGKLDKTGGDMTGNITMSTAGAAYNSVGLKWSTGSFIGTDDANGLGLYATKLYLCPGSSQGTSSGKGLVISETDLTYKGGGFEIQGTSSVSSYANGGGAFHNGYANLLLRGNATTGVSGIVFTSSKGTTSVNQPSGKAFIQYHPMGVTTLSAEGNNPTLGTSGEANKLVIGVGNDSDDMVYIQAPAKTGIRHIAGTTNSIMLDSANYYGYVDTRILGQCDTAAATAAKTVTLPGYYLRPGSVIRIKVNIANTAASALTLQVNPGVTGNAEKTIKILTANNTWTTTSATVYTLAAGNYDCYYDGTNWLMMPTSSNVATVSNNVAILAGQDAYATKNVFAEGFRLASGESFKLYVDTPNTSATALKLNVNNTGEKPLYINNAATSTSSYTFKSNWYTVYYDGTNYYANAATTANKFTSNYVYYGTTASYTAWAANKAYAVNDNVTYSGEAWTCKTAHTSGASWSSTNWSRISAVALTTTIPGITEYKEGLVVSLKFACLGGESSTTVNINNLGAKTLLRGTNAWTRGLIGRNGCAIFTYNGSNFSAFDYNTDTKQNVTLGTTTKAYITGVSTAPTSTAQALAGIADTEVFLTTTAGQLNAKSYKVAEKATMQFNTTDNCVEFVF